MNRGNSSDQSPIGFVTSPLMRSSSNTPMHVAQPYELGDTIFDHIC